MQVSETCHERSTRSAGTNLASGLLPRLGLEKGRYPSPNRLIGGRNDARSCSTCKSGLTKENASPAIVKKGSGYCRSCNTTYDKNRSKRKSRSKDFHAYRRTVSGRHRFLCTKLKSEKVPASDLLWRRSFYSSFVAEFRCHYCDGPLSDTGHSLDRIANDVGHRCFNVVPCCRVCNSVKSSHFTYQEMRLLSPVLKRIREARK
jgi:hypothetical protein